EPDTDIFEPPSPEYKRVYERLPLPSADILTQVVRSLPEMLPEPETNPASIFEDKSHIDYAGASFSPAHPITVTQALENLVIEGNHEQASSVLDELLEVGTEIPASSSYEVAALAVIKAQARTETEMNDQVQKFRKWFSLVLPADQSPPRRFRKICDRIMLSPLNSLRLMMEFGLIAAEKGYASRTHPRVTSLISMYGNPDVTIQFIDEVRRRNRSFLERSSASANADIMDRKLHVDIVGVAVRTLANAGRFDHAVQLIPDPGSGFHLTPYTYYFLVNKLEMTQDPRYLPHINFVVQYKSEVRTVDRRTRETTDDGGVLGAAEAKSLLSAEEIHISSFFSSQPPRRVKNNLAHALRALKKGLRAFAPSLRPHPLTIARFMELYLDSGRTRAIPLLRNFALRGTAGAHLYIFAEMLFHARNRNPDLVIQTFVTHFYIVGLPRDDIILRLGAMEHDPETAYIWAATPRRKLYPDPVHAAVVWRALLELTRDERALLDLYAKLLKFADLRSMQSSALHPGIPLLHPPPAWKTGADSSAFTPFIRRICKAFGSDRGALILKHMVDLGIKPNIYSLTELAMEYSRTGDVTRTFALLNQVESALKSWEDADAAEEADGAAADEETVRQRRATQSQLIPRVDQVFYIALIRGFLLSGKIPAARDVERRMSNRYGYVAGKDQYLDELYNDLEAAEGGAKIPHRTVRALSSYPHVFLLTRCSPGSPFFSVQLRVQEAP
ncbi:hypothetical protein DFH09DRAFT_905715, partial [Mycena vulgaris]